MTYTTLISTADLADNLTNDSWVVVDCRFRLDDTEAGRAGYCAGHIPGAVYAHLDDNLSGPIVPGETGRHPLPDPDTFAETLGGWGISNATQVVVYDDARGLFAGRLWWMLRWMGHDAVALLDGGWNKWSAEERPAARGNESNDARRFTPQPDDLMQATVDEVEGNLEHPTFLLLDARDEARFRGETTGVDAIGGHIPGARSAYFAHNLNEDGTFRSPAELRAHYGALIGDDEAGDRPNGIVVSCGSGVSAAHDILAMRHAGLDDARLYVGSWSEWTLDPQRPVATGE